MGKQYLNGVVYGGVEIRGDYVCDLLYENTDFSVASGASDIEHIYTLNASINNYDMVEVFAYMQCTTSNVLSQLASVIIPKSDYYKRTSNPTSNWVFLINGSVINTNRRFTFKFDDSITLHSVSNRAEGEEPKLYKVYGYKFGNQHNYSTDEKVVGTWIDGATIYEKTINFGALPNSTSKSVAHGISNLDYIISMTGTAQQSTGLNRIPIPFVNVDIESSVATQIRLMISDTDIAIQCGSDRSDFTKCYITIQYTKTS